MCRGSGRSCLLLLRTEHCKAAPALGHLQPTSPRAQETRLRSLTFALWTARWRIAWLVARAVVLGGTVMLSAGDLGEGLLRRVVALLFAPLAAL